MPLVIAVLIIIVVCINTKDSNKRAKYKSGQFSKDVRRTNARLEHKLMYHYMSHGYEWSDAYELTKQDMIDRGFEPAIPKSEYVKNSTLLGKRDEDDPLGMIISWKSHEDFDSAYVKDRMRQIEEHEELGLDVPELYDDMPADEHEYSRYLKIRSSEYRSIDIGKWVSVPGHGTCEVVGYTTNWRGERSGYKLKSVKTGEIIEDYRIGDSRIQQIK